METPAADVEISEEVTQLLCNLLATHYVEGGVPFAIVEQVEATLKSVGRWFPDPQHPYHPEFGYL
jgi:hypothetical protein